MMSQKQIQAAVDAGAPTYDDGKLVLVDGILYKVLKGAVRFKRAPSQRETRRRLGIVLAAPAPVIAAPAPVIAAPKPAGVRVIFGPAAVRYGRRGATLDFIKTAARGDPRARPSR